MTRRFWFFSAALGTKLIPFRVLRAAAAFPTAGYGWFPLYLLLVALRKGRRHPGTGRIDASLNIAPWLRI